MRHLKDQGFVPVIEMEAQPDEFDAHRVAVEIFESIHGRNALDAYVSLESSDPKMANFYKRPSELTEKLSAWSS